MVSPIPRLSIPANGARGRLLNPDDNHFGRAHPSNREKWLKSPYKDISENYHSKQDLHAVLGREKDTYLTIRISESR